MIAAPGATPAARVLSQLVPLACARLLGQSGEMDYETIKADALGKMLRGIGLNMLVRDVPAQCTFLETVFGLKSHQISADFAIVTYGDQVFQLHSDATYHASPLLSLLPENPPRGAGIEIRLFDTDPDAATTKAKAVGTVILQAPSDKPHGLREAYILCDNGYAWVPSRPL
jgi:predicted enzyme related to lactoylglutathione lyase